MSWDRTLFSEFKEINLPFPVTIADCSAIPCCGVGNVELQLQQPDSMTLPSYRITIQGVHFMPDLMLICCQV